MNSRKSAKTVSSTITRMLKSGSLLKSPPPSYYALLNHPPAPSLQRSTPSRELDDLPRTTTQPTTLYRQLKQAREQGIKLTPEQQSVLDQGPQQYSTTRRKPPKHANSTNSTPLPIVYTQDQIRTQFYRDHPFEAYRAKDLNEQQLVQDEPEPRAQQWTELSQRSINPTAEESVEQKRRRRPQKN